MIFYIVLGVISFLVLICIILFIISLNVHKKLFSNRFKSDSRISFYNKEEFGLNSKPIEISMGEVALRGAIYSYPNYKSDSIFVYCHGMWSGIPEYMQDIEFFCKNGYPVLAIEYEGTNDSSGKNIRGLSNSLRCIDKAIDYIESDSKLKDKKIYVAGHSWGGFAASNIVKYHKNIKGIIAISPFISIKNCYKGLLNKALWCLIPFLYLIDLVKCGKYAKSNTIKSLKEFKGNIVILHSKNDRIVKFKYNTLLLMNNKNIKANYIIVDDKNHHPHYSKEALALLNEYEEKLRFLKTEEERTNYMKTVNFHKLGELDYEVLTKALNLLIGD